MRSLLYGELTPWYHLLDPVEEHREEAEAFTAAFAGAVDGKLETLLELGAGAGNNGFYLKRRLQCTLTDLSPEMLELSRKQNPECEHVVGDMRTLRLDRQFDAVLAHDAITYMANEEDLRAAVRTAWIHTRPGGAALFAPDCYRETFEEGTETIVRSDGVRHLGCLESSWDPDPSDQTCRVDYAFLLREGTDIRAVHEHYIEGLFEKELWEATLEGEGFRVSWIERPIGDGEFDQVLLGVRPPNELRTPR
jgi:SAM-dependent methyltransferase